MFTQDKQTTIFSLDWLWQDEPEQMALVPAPRPELVARQQGVIQVAAQKCLPVQYIGVAPVIVGHRVLPGRRYDWVVVNLAEDPLFHDPDGFPIPERVLADLCRIQRSGVDFDNLYVVHEVERGTVQQGVPLTADMLMPPPPRAMQQLSQDLGNVGRTLWAAAAFPLAVAAIAAPAVAIAAVMSLDPMLLGVVVGPNRPVRPGEPAAWFYLSHWRYNEED